MPRPVSRGGSADKCDMSVNLAPNEPSDDAEEESMSRQRAGNDRDDSTIIFRSSKGERFIWPFDHCRTFESIEPLLKEVYILLRDQELVEEVVKGNYEIQTEDGAIILPTLWNSIIKPNLSIKIHFRSRKSAPPSETEDEWYQLDSRLTRGEAPEDDVDEWNAPRSPLPDRRELRGEPSEGSSDIESQTMTESEDEPSEQVVRPEPPREVVPPTDTEGNKLSFKVNTTYARAWQQHQSGGNGHTAEKFTPQEAVQKATSENLKITKVTALKDEGRSMLQIHTVTGPENVAIKKKIGIRWYHLRSEELSFLHFTEACLAVPDLSIRMQMLIKKTLDKIRKEKLKMSLDGMFIEPGTVLRGDEDCQSDPQSVVFCCIPYFDLQSTPKKTTNAHAGQHCPSKTLIQTYYPYEPVLERDAEQAYRKFGDEHSNRLIHVPNLWIMNIGSHAVVTCGHQPLAKDFVKSIEIVPEDPQYLGTQAVARNTTTNIRLTDWDGRVLLFSTGECRTYFQMEQKLKEIRLSSRRKTERRYTLGWVTTTGEKNVTPLIWNEIIKQSYSASITLTVVDKNKTKELGSEHTKMSFPGLLALSTLSNSVPPFFHWPQAMRGNDEANGPPDSQRSIPSDVRRAISRLESAEKAMMSATLSSRQTWNAVDVTFTSTSFYESLPEETFKQIDAKMSSLLRLKDTKTEPEKSKATHHQAVIHTQCLKTLDKTSEFLQIVNATLKLFVEDVDKTTMLRRVWGSMASICSINAKICQRGALGVDAAEYSDPLWTHAEMEPRLWFVRDFLDDPFIPAPEADEDFVRSIRSCRRCRHQQGYSTPQAALEHLQKHLKSTPSEGNENHTRMHPVPNLPPGQVVYSSTNFSDDLDVPSPLQAAQRGVPIENPTHSASKTDPPRSTSSTINIADQYLKNLVVNSAQLKREETNAGSLAILSQACETAGDLFVQARELAEGVRNEDETMSELYHLPDQLLEAFREIVVFYLAVERALFYTEDTFLKDSTQNSQHQESYEPELGLKVLKRFGDGAQLSLANARNELCRMVMSTPPLDIFGRLSLGPEYLCSWFMRRLLVKPLEKSMAVADMYREYLSTIQFQVNHRPGKRLLRSINLLKEELLILKQINAWQTKTITSYIRVLDHTTYENDIPSRRGMFPYEHLLLRSCLESLALAQEEYADQISRCGPLSDTTKQSLEINEEDHGKAIMVFTITTLIFLPLSFVTSYLGMNSSDLRDMESGQSLFWMIAVPLTVFTVSSIMYIGYNGDGLRDLTSSIYRTLTGKQDRRTSARGISVAQRKGAQRVQGDSNSILDHKSYADEAEFADPRSDCYVDQYSRAKFSSMHRPELEPANYDMDIPATRLGYQVQSYAAPISRHSPNRLETIYTNPEKPQIDSRHWDGDAEMDWLKSTPRRPAARHYNNEWAAPTPRVRIADTWAIDYDEEEERRDQYTWHKKDRRGASRKPARHRYARRRPERYRE